MPVYIARVQPLVSVLRQMESILCCPLFSLSMGPFEVPIWKSQNLQHSIKSSRHMLKRAGISVNNLCETDVDLAQAYAEASANCLYPC
jgi:hypothetical protein